MIAILHWKKADIAIPAKRAMIDSTRVAKVSVVRPFKLVMSSERMLVRIPGAFSLRSNQETCLWIKDL